MAEKQNHKERLKEITGSIETGIMALCESDKYKRYRKRFAAGKARFYVDKELQRVPINALEVLAGKNAGAKSVFRRRTRDLQFGVLLRGGAPLEYQY